MVSCPLDHFFNFILCLRYLLPQEAEVKSETVPDVKPEDAVVVSESDVASQEVVSSTVTVTSPSTTTSTTTTLTSPVVKTESASPISTSELCLPTFWCLPNFIYFMLVCHRNPDYCFCLVNVGNLVVVFVVCSNNSRNLGEGQRRQHHIF